MPYKRKDGSHSREKAAGYTGGCFITGEWPELSLLSTLGRNSESLTASGDCLWLQFTCPAPSQSFHDVSYMKGASLFSSHSL